MTSRSAPRSSRLSPLKDGLALLGERRQAFFSVLAVEEAAELVRLPAEALDVVALEGLVERALRGRQRQGALRGEQLPHFERVLEHQIVDAVHEPSRQRLLCVDNAAGEDQLLREPEAGYAREPL